MAEDLILSEATENTFTHCGWSPVSLLPKCVLLNGEDPDWSASKEIFTFLFIINVYPQNPKIYI